MEFKKMNDSNFNECRECFIESLTDLMERESYLEEGFLEEEIQRIQSLYFDESSIFFGAFEKAELLGTIAFTPMSTMIKENTNIPHHVYEISTVYIKKQHQRKGIGSYLFKNILNYLYLHNVEYFYLDAGFSSSQGYWLGKINNPDIVLKDFWGPGIHHYVWYKKIEESMEA